MTNEMGNTTQQYPVPIGSEVLIHWTGDGWAVDARGQRWSRAADPANALIEAIACVGDQIMQATTGDERASLHGLRAALLQVRFVKDSDARD